MYSLFFDTIGWETGRASGLEKSCFGNRKGSPLEAFRESDITWIKFWKNKPVEQKPKVALA